MYISAPLSLLGLAAFASANTFTVSATFPSREVPGQEVNAAGGAFYIGLDGPATYCPDIVNPNCPNVTGTVVADLTALWVEVPGGQQMYISPEGPLGFTSPHSAYYPTGSFFGGFTNITLYDADSSPYTVFGWAAPSAAIAKGSGLFACPTSTAGVLQINAQTPAFNRTDCTDLAGLKPTYQSSEVFGAWEYT